MSPQPWSPEKRAKLKHKIDREAARAAARVGGAMAVLIVFFPDGKEHMHMLQGGDAPMDTKMLFASLSTAEQLLEQSGGKDVAIS